MLPVLQERLSVDEIAQYWSLEIQPPRPSEELVDFLEAAWWLGKLESQPPFPNRLAVLKAIFRSTRAGDGTGVLFFTPEETQGTEQPDGSLVFKSSDLMQKRVPVPSADPEMWSEPSLARAFEKLSKTPSRKHYPEYYVGFLLMQVHRDQFVSLLTEHSLELPKFWRPAAGIPKEAEMPKEDAGARVAKTLHRPGSNARKRGPKPIKLEQVKEAMRRDLQKGMTLDHLSSMPEKVLAEEYQVSRDTARKARSALRSEIVEDLNRDK